MEDQLFQTSESEYIGDAANRVDHDGRKFLLFTSDTLLFGAAVEHVVEIITNHTVTQLPLTPAYVHGIINLRGQIIPIVDMRSLLGQMPQDGECIIILNIEDVLVGILVDTVQKMIDVDEKTILPSPQREEHNMVCGMCSLPEGQTMLVFDALKLLQQ